MQICCQYFLFLLKQSNFSKSDPGNLVCEYEKEQISILELLSYQQNEIEINMVSHPKCYELCCANVFLKLTFLKTLTLIERLKMIYKGPSEKKKKDGFVVLLAYSIM